MHSSSTPYSQTTAKNFESHVDSQTKCNQHITTGQSPKPPRTQILCTELFLNYKCQIQEKVLRQFVHSLRRFS